MTGACKWIARSSLELLACVLQTTEELQVACLVKTAALLGVHDLLQHRPSQAAAVCTKQEPCNSSAGCTTHANIGNTLPLKQIDRKSLHGLWHVQSMYLQMHFSACSHRALAVYNEEPYQFYKSAVLWTSCQHAMQRLML